MKRTIITILAFMALLAPAACLAASNTTILDSTAVLGTANDTTSAIDLYDQGSSSIAFEWFNAADSTAFTVYPIFSHTSTGPWYRYKPLPILQYMASSNAASVADSIIAVRSYPDLLMDSVATQSGSSQYQIFWKDFSYMRYVKLVVDGYTGNGNRTAVRIKNVHP